MPDLERVIYSIERCICHVPDACRDCAYDAGHPYNECVELLLRDALELLKAHEPRWISVKDRLPEEYGNYLAVVDGEVTECTYSGPFIKGIISGWSTCNANGLKWLRDEHVTCWMPLPEPPKEECRWSVNCIPPIVRGEIMTADDRKPCWLMEGCPSRTGVCYSCVPDGDNCPIWRWFKKQIIVRCKECTQNNQCSIQFKFADADNPGEWFCAYGKRR